MKADTKQNLSCNVVPGATGIHWFKDDETAEITTADKTLMTKIRKAAKESNEVIIDSEPNADNGGFMLALVPVKFIKISKPKKVNFTKEQKKAMAERMRKLHNH
jgi:hypothetical protein